MYVDSPMWRLKQRCPCCGQGYLELHTCDECKKVVAICDETDTVFTDPLNISSSDISEKEKDVCAYCGAVEKMGRAKDFEIINLGLTTADYE